MYVVVTIYQPTPDSRLIVNVYECRDGNHAQRYRKKILARNKDVVGLRVTMRRVIRLGEGVEE